MDENMGSAPPTPPAPPVAPPAAGGARPGPESDTSKLLAALGYIFGVVAIVAILIEPYKNEKFVKFHAIQALGLWVVGVLVQFVSVVPIIGWIIAPIASLAVFVYAIILAVKAFQGGYMEIPVVYGIVQNYIDG